jgi:Zn-dependent protease
LDKIQSLLLTFPVLLFSVIAHEYAHGYAALKQGDTTALMLGRLTWNPVKHIDPFMTILMPAMLFLVGAPILGGAKPVPVNPRNYRKFKQGDIIVSLAGVFTNLLVAILCVIIIALTGMLGNAVPAIEPSLGILQAMMWWGVIINMSLIAFNLIPIPPLDGSHVMKYLLPPAWSLKYQQFGRFGLLILIALLWVAPGILQRWINPAIQFGLTMIGFVSRFGLESTNQWLPR